jgi:leucyl aminopeptidase (aminopeptidase T)
MSTTGSPDDADAQAVAEAHRADLRVQAKYDTRYLNYWIDVRSRKNFCLVDAPDEATAHAVHREAHGLVADEIYRVEQG